MPSSVLKRQVVVLRAMTPEQKVRASEALHLAAWGLKAAWLRSQHPPVLTIVLALLVGAGACSGQPLASLTTGLTGIVVRGPVAPVCQTGESCDAPFSAGFTVLRGSRPVTSFRSDEQGHFTVRLEPGTYTVVPGPDAPILSPQDQAQEVVAGPSGLTTVRLEFDTGIR